MKPLSQRLVMLATIAVKPMIILGDIELKNSNVRQAIWTANKRSTHILLNTTRLEVMYDQSVIVLV